MSELPNEIYGEGVRNINGALWGPAEVTFADGEQVWRFIGWAAPEPKDDE